MSKKYPLLDLETDIPAARDHLLKTISKMEEDPESVPKDGNEHPAVKAHKRIGGSFRTQMPLTTKRITVFLETLAETGSHAAAARAATPWSKAYNAGLDAFRNLRKNNEEFEKLVKMAEGFARGRLEAEMHRRTMTPVMRPIVSRGKIVAYEEKWDNRLLLRTLERLDPAWSQKQDVHHSGEVKGGVLAVPMAIESEKDWEKQFENHEHPLLDVAEAEIEPSDSEVREDDQAAEEQSSADVAEHSEEEAE